MHFMADDRKNILVSPVVHEELSMKKWGDETFDQVLRRVLGLLPQNTGDLASVLPTQLDSATNSIVRDHIGNDDSFAKIGDEGEASLALKFVSNETNKTIFEVEAYLPSPGKERINHRVDLRYRNHAGKMERILLLRDIEENQVDVEEYKDSETYEIKSTTFRGDDAGEKTAASTGPHVAKFVDQAREKWG